MKKITLYNRESNKLDEESIPGRHLLNFIYNTKSGLLISEKILKKKFFSHYYGNILKKPGSKKRISKFIQKYNINLDEFLDPVASFNSFNDFFIRKLKPMARPVNLYPEILISPADSRLSVHNIRNDYVIPVKGRKFTLLELTCNPEITEKYHNGLCLIFRLAPVDYHRFCYIDEGEQTRVISAGKFFHSVNPVALKTNLPVFQGNYREYCELKTKNFGEVLEIEVGAMGVSKIIQFYPDGYNFKRGEEKGYFEFGGSTIIMIFKQNTISIDDDILKYSEAGIETLVKYASSIGKKIS